MEKQIRVTPRTSAVELLNEIVKAKEPVLLQYEFQGLTMSVQSQLMKINGVEMSSSKR
ncbi:hypothetical protein [Pseudoalteromonas sp. CO325X]|uniref:hypothetical protein n=1 Tax=Pseudoalteromonas sp. CO325X TaxID=1777262 RepID=UPI0013EE830F|nr:hypothetical protein [Pseudoalteromonas sp. CO325X]